MQFYLNRSDLITSAFPRFLLNLGSSTFEYISYINEYNFVYVMVAQLDATINNIIIISFDVVENKLKQFCYLMECVVSYLNILSKKH